MPKNRFKSSLKALSAYPIIEKWAQTALLRRRDEFTGNSGAKLQLRARRRGTMGKYNVALWAMLAVTAAAAPAFAQDVPAAAEKKAPVKAGTLAKPGGAVSASYARCVPGQPAEPEATCPSADPAEGKGRTYTGGRRNDDAPTASAEMAKTGVAPVSADMPNRLSMTPTTAKKVAPPAAQPAKGHSEKGIK
jgi:hypothetical protein